MGEVKHILRSGMLWFVGATVGLFSFVIWGLPLIIQGMAALFVAMGGQGL